MFADKISDCLRAGSGLEAIRRSHKRGPERSIAPGQQSNRRRAKRRGCEIALAGRPFAAWPQPGPSDAPGKALAIEPGRIVIGKPRWQDFTLPGAGRRLEGFKLLDNGTKRIRALHPRVRRDMLPVKQKAQEIARGDGLD